MVTDAWMLDGFPRTKQAGSASSCLGGVGFSEGILAVGGRALGRFAGLCPSAPESSESCPSER